MPSLNITIADPQFTRLIPAVKLVTPHSPSETDEEVVLRWICRMATNTVFEYERNQALGNVTPDPDIVHQSS